MNRFLSDAGRMLAAADNLPSALQSVAQATVPQHADFCLIFLARNGDLPCVASAHATREGARLLTRLNRVYRITRHDPLSTVAHVVRTGRARLRSSIAGEGAGGQADLRVFRLHRRLGVRSALVVPIGSPPNVLGAISLSYGDSGRRYSAQDLPRVKRLAALVAAAIRRQDRAMRTAPGVPLVPRRVLRLRARA